MKQARIDEPPKSLEFEVRCLHCDTSFARGTRSCIHCGQRLGPAPSAHPLFEGLGEEVETEGEQGLPPGRAVVWITTAVVALVATLLRLCAA